MVQINYSRAHFISIYPTDKVLAISDRFASTIPGGEPTIPEGFNATLTHNAGPEVVVTGVFSIDGTNYYPFGGYIEGATDGSGHTEFITMDAYISGTGSIALFGANGFYDDQEVRFYVYLESIS